LPWLFAALIDRSGRAGDRYADRSAARQIIILRFTSSLRPRRVAGRYRDRQAHGPASWERVVARFGGEGASRPGVRTRTAVNSIPVLRSARGKLLNEAIARLWASKPFPRRSWGDRSL